MTGAPRDETNRVGRPARRRSDRRPGLGLLIVVMTVTAIAAADAAAEIAVVDHAWTGSIVQRNASDRYTDRAPLGSPLYLWTRLRGDAAALDALRAGGKLPIRHEWVKYVGPDPDIDTLRPTDEIDVGGVREAVIETVAAELSQRGFFDWRTWSRKQNLSPGTHAVRVVYADGSPVTCRIDGVAARPCVFRIRVTRRQP